MMFNGLLVCGDSDTSDFTKESIGASSALGSASSDMLSPSECLQEKLLATMQILENKEETIRVQAQSLALSEARIAALTERAEMYRRQLTQQSPLTPDPHAVEKTDISFNTDIYQEGMTQKKIVTTLQDNLSVIEELYRECFYETAKQEELIDLLRNSFSDVRMMEKRKTEQIGHLQNVVNNQKWSLDQCQDIAMEVESLKSEISNFLNSSNYDSGMWEREDSLAGELGGDLQHIGEQLLRLRELLASDCVCGSRDENSRLRQTNVELEAHGKELQQRVQELEAALQDKDREITRHQRQLGLREQEFQLLSLKLGGVEQSCRQQAATCESLTGQLQHLETLLTNKSAELAELQRQHEARGSALGELHEQLNNARVIIEQERDVRVEVSRLSRTVCHWRGQLAASRQRMRELEQDLEHAREKASSVSQLQAELEEAHSRGAQLCGDTHRLVGGLRAGLRQHRQQLREQEDKIKEQDEIIRRLQQFPDRGRPSASDNEPCCSRYIPRDEPRRDGRSSVGASQRSDCTKCASLGQRTKSDRDYKINSYSNFRRMVGERGIDVERTSESEKTSSTSPPKPPRRLFRKKKTAFLDKCSWTHCEAGVQRVVRCDAASGPGPQCARCTCLSAGGCSREMSATDELMERVRGARHALHAAHARWHRRHAHTHTNTRGHT